MSDTGISPILLCALCKKSEKLIKTKSLLLNGNDLFKRIGQRINDKDIPTICKFLSENTDIVKVNLAYNNITNNGVKGLLAFFKTHTSVTDLNLMNNNIDSEDPKLLSKLKELKITSLRLNGNKFGPNGGKYLARTLLKNSILQHLDVGDTDQTLESLVYFTTVLHQDYGGNIALKSINLNRVIGQQYYQLLSDRAAQVIGEMLQFNHSLQEIHLQKLNFSDHDVEVLVAGLIHNRHLLHLDLACNNISDYGIEALAVYLTTCPPLKSLVLHHNHISDTGARVLSFKMSYSYIEFLDISVNNIHDEGLLDILNSIKKVYPIQTLYIRGNKFGQPTCKVLYRMILSNIFKKDNLDVHVYKEDNTYKYVYNEQVDHTQPCYYSSLCDKYYELK